MCPSPRARPRGRCRRRRRRHCRRLNTRELKAGEHLFARLSRPMFRYLYLIMFPDAFHHCLASHFAGIPNICRYKHIDTTLPSSINDSNLHRGDTRFNSWHAD